VVAQLTLDIEPTFHVRQDVYEHLPIAQLESHFEQIVSSAYSVSLFTDWQSDRVNQVWRKRRVEGGTTSDAAPAFFGATLAPQDRHPIAAISAENCTAQMGVPGPWHERLPHFRMDYTPSSGQELQSEYFVPRHHAVAAFAAVAAIKRQIAPLLFISEIRTIAADTLWISPCHQRACVGFHFTWKQDWPAVRELLPKIESQLSPFEARPHWGKLFSMSPQRLQSLYKKLPDFRRLLLAHDPRGKFCNEFVDTYVADK
jgi:xylitol oxidase